MAATAGETPVLTAGTSTRTAEERVTTASTTVGGPDNRSSESSSNGGHDVLGVSASVGHDHWAQHALSAVHPAPATTTAAEDESKSASGPETSGSLPSVAERVAERRRKFHSGRQLELKNLPDGCTEQVSQPARRRESQASDNGRGKFSRPSAFRGCIGRGEAAMRRRERVRSVRPFSIVALSPLSRASFVGSPRFWPFPSPSWPPRANALEEINVRTQIPIEKCPSANIY